MRHIIALGFCLTLTACWTSDDEVVSAPTSCPYEAPGAVPQYQLSTYPDLMNTGIDQDKLIRFMSVAPKEAPCYVLSNNQITLVKMAVGVREPNPEFENYIMAGGEAEQNWLKATDNLNNSLMGLTTIHFAVGGSKEQIKSINITVREDARRWHLWHEYSHALIGQARAANPQQSLYIPSEKYLDKQLQDLQQLQRSTDEYSQALQKLLQGYRDRIDKNYVDEILIEATLIDLSRQHPLEIGLLTEDYLRSMGAIDFFTARYDQFYKSVRENLEQLLLENQDQELNKQLLVRQMILIADQHRKISQISDQATSEIDLSEASGIQ